MNEESFHNRALHHTEEAHRYVEKLIARTPTSDKRNLYTDANIHFLLALEALAAAEKTES